MPKPGIAPGEVAKKRLLRYIHPAMNLFNLIPGQLFSLLASGNEVQKV
ncbi:hypothetical protein TREPR_1210 [Treponema primitia ZAS-2]|uniref:Uncharacterized protein n=1 Tax=Treponema primitia (strain ATCC BAA-887 / DSM 12427 / ZAS-2) TaxID=545694 RepID=F5YGS0_TREPZ|nr:hypothetical protein TREPR_1210 [Treponema primitia ZAS-2]